MADNCEFKGRKRTEKGWTLDFVFNRNNINWYSNNVFYYIGVRGDNDIEDYADNNLSFQFTADRRIKWVAYRYSGVCDPTDGYSESYYLDQGTTPQLCTTGATKDFNVNLIPSTISVNSNIFRTYNSRNGDDGFFLANGNKVTCTNIIFNLSYEMKQNLFFDLGFTSRKFFNTKANTTTSSTIFQAAMRLNIGRREYDF